MQGIDFSQFDALEADIDKALKAFPSERRALHEKMGDAIKETLDQEITWSFTGMGDKIKNWQKKYVGSGGGYAAVRADDVSTGKNSPGAITNYLENGHKIRPPSGKAKRYKPRITHAYVDGRHFYARATKRSEGELIKLAEAFANDLADKIEGK